MTMEIRGGTVVGTSLECALIERDDVGVE